MEQITLLLKMVVGFLMVREVIQVEFLQVVLLII